ncbi:carbohydrate ABC transporter substrate-binding protein, CUT1 family [Jannaschia faecimaris]|uniref:Carbohydrate ABC transporter substrate-binding protein, CUT1 family n=1 Tax=Jannaschia faecimaris TaxID=1244108 RepID=A0A1H3R3S7_9RHOB|nr:extracellular solute-binding protein [Jannaschia faecimaris]SDZ20444.1 carbohydrate ABC transporter substrate-binding protein, CUT1 family [Jannaschia faecimaris]
MSYSKLATASAIAIAVAGVASTAQAEDLTLCWAAWDPANALVELSKDFEAQSGHTMNFEFVPWPNFADRMLNELNSGGKLCDLLIGDSQWIGGGAENGHYVKLNDFFDAEGISMDDFVPATVYAYSTWPKGTPNYYALPAMADANGWFYRKDWFERDDIKDAFKAETGRDLTEPATQKELLEIAQFFQEREIDGQTVYGASIFTERGSEGITMGITSALYPWGFKYENTPGTYDMEGAVNSPEAVEALEFYKEFYETATPPGYTNSYMGESLDAFKSGQVAMAMNWFAFFPGLASDPDVGDKIDFFVNPPQNQAGSTLGGQGISVVSYSDKQDAALEYIKWFSDPAVQAKWSELGGASAHKSVFEDPAYTERLIFGADFVEAMDAVQDFWQEPAYAELLLAMQKRMHDYVVADQGTAKEALDKLIEDWTEVFEDEGKL